MLNFNGLLERRHSLCRNRKILKLIDIIMLSNIPFVLDQMNNDLPNAFENYFELKRQQHYQFTRGKIQMCHRLMHPSMAPIR